MKDKYYQIQQSIKGLNVWFDKGGDSYRFKDKSAAIHHTREVRQVSRDMDIRLIKISEKVIESA